MVVISDTTGNTYNYYYDLIQGFESNLNLNGMNTVIQQGQVYTFDYRNIQLNNYYANTNPSLLIDNSYASNILNIYNNSWYYFYLFID